MKKQLSKSASLLHLSGSALRLQAAARVAIRSKMSHAGVSIDNSTAGHPMTGALSASEARETAA